MSQWPYFAMWADANPSTLHFPAHFPGSTLHLDCPQIKYETTCTDKYETSDISALKHPIRARKTQAVQCFSTVPWVGARVKMSCPQVVQVVKKKKKKSSRLSLPLQNHRHRGVLGLRESGW